MQLVGNGFDGWRGNDDHLVMGPKKEIRFRGKRLQAKDEFVYAIAGFELG